MLFIKFGFFMNCLFVCLHTCNSVSCFVFFVVVVVVSVVIVDFQEFFASSVYIKIRILRYIDTDKVRNNTANHPKRILHDKQKRGATQQFT